MLMGKLVYDIALSYKKLEEAEYTAWNNEFVKAKTAIGGDRRQCLKRYRYDGKGFNPHLQRCLKGIDKPAQAGLKIWFSIGDKLETAINIGLFSCSLLRQGMKQVCISTMNTADVLAKESKEMLVDDIGDVTITNNGAIILKMLYVEHPAAKVEE
ncbi:putative phospholipid-transporting ATPase 4 [Camellia lanceoleosa]|uniref:Phospholipid-transporting ATPase 4 n=1 Tax=Camellia lanceoleosa TaxID=1840588 RepID=A0ACC0HV98_9ERIC|nr:putative phospholipid-transporting ATPase 4 [Camellia lanceoleosa]